MKLKSILAIMIAAVTLISCDADGDVTKPEINLISHTDGTQYEQGAEMHFEMELSDDVALASYKVNIHSNFDGHDHSSVLSKDGDSSTEDWSYDNTWDEDIMGKRNTSIHHHEIVVPENATPGDYHFMVYCTDQAGNESYVVRSIEVIEPTSAD